MTTHETRRPTGGAGTQRSAWPEEAEGARRLLENQPPSGARAFAQQEAALERVGAQLRAANEKIEGIKQRLQAQISPKKR
jgi:hypothetical protein